MTVCFPMNPKRGRGRGGRYNEIPDVNTFDRNMFMTVRLYDVSKEGEEEEYDKLKI